MNTDKHRWDVKEASFHSTLLYLCSSVFICGCLLLPACTETPKVSDIDVKQIDYKQLRTMLESSKKGPTVLVDVRKPQKYAAEHIEGAVNIPTPEMVPGHPALAEARNIVVYANGWTDDLSRAGTKLLMRLGYNRVHEFRGGLELWKQEGGRTAGTGPETRPASGSGDGAGVR
jgi:rhodanese-related sulfurtransferase